MTNAVNETTRAQWLEKITKLEIEYVCENTRGGKLPVSKAIYDFKTMLLVYYFGFEMIEDAKTKKLVKLREDVE